jgi:streptogramin lyase
VITEWTLRVGSEPTGAAPQGQKVAFAEEDGHVAVLDPNGSTLTEWEVPLIETVRLPLGVATQGKFIFFTDYLQGAIGMLNTSNDQMTLWRMPGAPFRRPNQMVITGPSSNFQVWVADSVGWISMLSPATNTFTEWPAPPITQQPVLQNLAITANGIVIFNDFVNSMVGVLDPAANFIREWSVPTANSYPVNVAALTRDIIVFAEQQGDRIGTLDLNTAPDLATAITPTVTTVTPTIQVVNPNTTAVATTVTPVAPTITGASRFITGGFAEYPIPTPFSGPVGLSINSNGAILFTESSSAGNRIGLLQ